MGSRLKVLLAAFVFGLLAMPAWAQNSAPTLNDAISGYESAAHQSFQGLATDWSSHHVVYSKPAPGSDAEYKVQQDPRYWQQQIRRSLTASSDSGGRVGGRQGQSEEDEEERKSRSRSRKTWSMNLQRHREHQPRRCISRKVLIFHHQCRAVANDYVAYPTGLAPNGTHPSIVGFTNIYYSGSTCGATIPTVSWSYNTSAADAAARSSPRRCCREDGSSR